MSCRLHIGRLRGPFALSAFAAPLSAGASPGVNTLTVSGTLIGADMPQWPGATPAERMLNARDEIESLASTHPEGVTHPVVFADDTRQSGWYELRAASVDTEGLFDGHVEWSMNLEDIGTSAGRAAQETVVYGLGVRTNFRPVWSSNPEALLCRLDPNNINCRRATWSGGIVATPVGARAHWDDPTSMATTEEWDRVAATFTGTGTVKCFTNWSTQTWQYLGYYVAPSTALDGGCEIWTGGTRTAWAVSPSSPAAGTLRSGFRLPPGSETKPWELNNGLISVQPAAGGLSIAAFDGTTWSPRRYFRIRFDSADLAVTNPAGLTITRNAPDGAEASIELLTEHRPASGRRYAVEMHLLIRRGCQRVDIVLATPDAAVRAIETPGDASQRYTNSTLYSAVDTTPLNGWRHLIGCTEPISDTGIGWSLNDKRTFATIQMVPAAGGTHNTPAERENEWMSDILASGNTYAAAGLTRW